MFLLYPYLVWCLPLHYSQLKYLPQQSENPIPRIEQIRKEFSIATYDFPQAIPVSSHQGSLYGDHLAHGSKENLVHTGAR